MSWPAVAVSPADAGQVLERAGFQHLPVITGGDAIGMLCACDLRLALPTDRVVSCMSRRVIAIDPEAPAIAAVVTMDELRINALPVPWRGAWGIVTRGDLTRAGLCDRPACMACGAAHHVRRHACGAMWFCLDCVDPRDDPALYCEVGIVD